MPTVISGLPAHVLLVHLVVVFVPLAAVLVVLSAAWPAARRRLNWVTPLVALVALIAVPVTTNAGHWLQRKLAAAHVVSPLITRHAQLGATLLPYAIGLFAMALVVWLVGRRDDRAEQALRTGGDDAEREVVLVSSSDGGGTAVLEKRHTTTPAWLTVVITALAVAISAASVVDVYRVGDSGARAAWAYVQQLH